MANSGKRITLTTNLFLDAVPTAQRHRLTRSLKLVLVPVQTVLFEAGQTIDFVYFPLTCVISLVTPFKKGASVEVATVGREGIVGVPAVGGGSLSVRAVVSVGGWIARVPTATFVAEVNGDGDVRERIDVYLQVLFGQIAQATACNRLHSNQARLSRWLLTSHDRMGAGELDVTLEFLGQMLGCRRASVARAVEALQSSGLVRHGRGHIDVVDIPGLEALACECYTTIKAALAERGPRPPRRHGTIPSELPAPAFA